MRLFTDAAASIDSPYMRRAYDLALRGLGRTSPNPAVGCVIVASDGAIVGEGWHKRAGDRHAEVNALLQAGSRAGDSTVYVTLEPCTHFGKTPPCVDALLEAGVAKVHIGMPDTDHVAAGGAEKLRSFGVDASFVEDPAPFVEINEGWLKHLSSGLPWVTAKVALSLDGKVARAAGVRTKLSASGSRELTMRMRGMADAVMVGARTLAVDAPSLLVRDSDDAALPLQPARVVLCRDAVPREADMFVDEAGPVLVLAPPGKTQGISFPAQVEAVEYDPVLGLSSALAALADRGMRRVFVEPGPELMSGLWQSGLIDELVLIHAGGFAGSAAPGIYPGEGEGSLSELDRRLVAVESGIIDGDAITRWAPRALSAGVHR